MKILIYFWDLERAELYINYEGLVNMIKYSLRLIPGYQRYPGRNLI